MSTCGDTSALLSPHPFLHAFSPPRLFAFPLLSHPKTNKFRTFVDFNCALVISEEQYANETRAHFVIYFAPFARSNNCLKSHKPSQVRLDPVRNAVNHMNPYSRQTGINEYAQSSLSR